MAHDDHRYSRATSPNHDRAVERRGAAPGRRAASESVYAGVVQRSARGASPSTLTDAIGDAVGETFVAKPRREQLATLRAADPAEQAQLLAQVPQTRSVWLVRALEPAEQAALLSAMDDPRRRATMEMLGEAAVAGALDEASLPPQAEARIVLAAPPEMQMDLLLSLAFAKRYEPFAHMPAWQLGQILDEADYECLRMLVAPMPVSVLAPLFAQMVPKRQARVQSLLPANKETALALDPAATSPVQRKAKSGSEIGEYLSSLFAPGAAPRAFPVQRSSVSAEADDDVHGIAAHGVASASSPLPHLGRIQESFGRHGISGVRSEVGGAAGTSAAAIGAEAYATGDRVAFAKEPDLHTAAHEAAHVVQQRAGVQLKGGVGAAGDVYEQHADAVADKVVAGDSAEALLDAGPQGGGSRAVQRKETSITDGVNAALDPSRKNDDTYAGAVRHSAEAAQMEPSAERARSAALIAREHLDLANAIVAPMWAADLNSQLDQEKLIGATPYVVSEVALVEDNLRRAATIVEAWPPQRGWPALQGNLVAASASFDQLTRQAAALPVLAQALLRGPGMTCLHTLNHARRLLSLGPLTDSHLRAGARSEASAHRPEPEAPSLLETDPTAIESDHSEAELRAMHPKTLDENRDRPCDGEGVEGHCFLSKDERAALLRTLGDHLSSAEVAFVSVLTDEKLTRKLAPRASKWELVIDVMYVMGNVVGAQAIKGAGKYLATESSNLARVSTELVDGQIVHKYGPEVIQNALKADALTFALKTATRGARTLAKKEVASITNEDTKTQFLNRLITVIATQKAAIKKAAENDLDDRQLALLTAFYEPENHTPERYKAEIQTLIARFDADVEVLGTEEGSPPFDRKVELRRIIGPHGTSRLAVCQIATVGAADSAKPRAVFDFAGVEESEIVHFDHWVHAQMTKAAEGRQQELNAAQGQEEHMSKRRSHTITDRIELPIDARVKTIAWDSPSFQTEQSKPAKHHPEVAAWAAQEPEQPSSE